ncbi:MAG: hypothetical protein KME49_18595 [Brasilonema octagenarum HA4186-MV1]|jgi:hypothetical protein|uniref:Uncharacterized protein n=2 Tax=Brasilonema TaxID=383614 RepID=A0A856MCD2_9CYAN|nr:MULTISPECIES: hypothetical protein [Brasilonema]MBW4627451.1 hypothetical protein [Brasilonema octagenarum HA4186-MV1]NMF62622.1 hypothetical protein [Brasilonema octagenarum UFV-OR1]QDL07980.1 hypothetical protein DP114_08760 [Brasilonema sennae CENA114]QDL14340.1 hypothetical protein DP113_08715 [Brasilonema octagenarum UFV-E1]
MQFRPPSWHQLILYAVGVCSLSLPFAQSVQATPAQEVRNFCRKQDSVFVAAETKNYWVSICGSDSPLTYVGVNKKTGQTVRLPLSVNGRDSQRKYFEAVNNDYTYILAESTKGKNLTVAKGIREILREPVIRGW